MPKLFNRKRSLFTCIVSATKLSRVVDSRYRSAADRLIRVPPRLSGDRSADNGGTVALARALVRLMDPGASVVPPPCCGCCGLLLPFALPARHGATRGGSARGV